MAIISACRKYRASEKVFIVPAGYQTPIHLIFVDYLFLKIFFVKSTPGICIAIVYSEKQLKDI